MSVPALQRRITDIIEEYEIKSDAVMAALKEFEDAGKAVKSASCIAGMWGEERLETGSISEREMRSSLLRSAWKKIYEMLSIDRIASAKDKKKFQQDLAKPIPFTLDNIRASLGDYILDPRGNILRGLAEVFCALDPAYKSHDKVKIGVKGLPKRVIITVSDYGWGRDYLENIINALAQLQGKPLVTYREIQALLKNEDALLQNWSEPDSINKEKIDHYPARGVRLRRFQNGNGHLFFEPQELLDINRGLAEYYGEVLPDCSEEKPTEKRASTAVSKDLQYYPTPKAVVHKVVEDLYISPGDKVLEPSCGCGRFMDALREKGADVFGIEYDAGRAGECRAKGHKVLIANFLETVPQPIYDRVVMNPPFYGKHYAKHVEHALKFLRPGGTLTAILPITARYDHGLLDGRWSDLPVGAFRESGTNINSTVLTTGA
jgi:hypothetical protein